MSDHIDHAVEVTTERVRSKFATVLDDTSGWKYDSECGRDFDRWLTAHDAAVAAKALRIVESVCMNTDGGHLEGEADIPVGEVMRMILLAEETFGIEREGGRSDA